MDEQMKISEAIGVIIKDLVIDTNSQRSTITIDEVMVEGKNYGSFKFVIERT